MLILGILLILPQTYVSQAASPSPNAPCSKVGVKQNSGNKIFTCQKKSGHLIWIQETQRTNSRDSLLDRGSYGIIRTVSSNGGKSQPMMCDASDGNQGFRSQKTLFVNPTNPKIIEIGIEYKGFYISTDAGQSWKISSTGLIGYPQANNSQMPCHAEFSSLIADPSNPQHQIMSRAGEPGTIKDYFSENAGIYETLDGGKSWKQILTQEAIGVYVHDGLAISNTNSKVMYAGTTTNPRRLNNENKVYVKRGVVYKTVNGGKSWEELPTGAPENIGVQSITLDPANDQIITISTFGRVQNSSGNSFGPGLGILKSSDGGAHWTRIDTLQSGFSTLEFSELKPQFGLGVTYDGKSLATSDGGATWSSLPGLYAFRGIGYNNFDSSGSSGLIADDSGSIFKFENNGQNVTPAGVIPTIQGLQTRVTKFAFGSDGSWYAAGHYTDNHSHQVGFVFKSTNLGQSWVKILDTDTLK
jgi:photosystem II stability/assembly factor-like uncharacterized protein